MIVERYFDYLKDSLDKSLEGQVEIINKAARLVSESIINGGRFYVFGSGHSHMIAEEIYIRAGGLAYIRGILPPELMLHEMPNKSTYLERLDGYSEALLNLYKVDDKDSILIISNSGRNSVPVEMALKAKEKGCKVIVMHSLEHSMKGDSRHKSGKRMYEFADVAIDTKVPAGDAAFYIDGVENPSGPLSTFIGTALVNSLVVQVIDDLSKQGYEVPIFRSSNLDNADEYNEKLFDKYYGYNK